MSNATFATCPAPRTTAADSELRYQGYQVGKAGLWVAEEESRLRLKGPGSLDAVIWCMVGNHVIIILQVRSASNNAGKHALVRMGRRIVLGLCIAGRYSWRGSRVHAEVFTAFASQGPHLNALSPPTRTSRSTSNSTNDLITFNQVSFLSSLLTK